MVRLPRRRYIPVACLVLVGVAVSMLLFWLVRGWEQASRRHEFDNLARTYTNAVEDTLNQYIGALLFLGDFFDNSSFVSRQEFDRLSESVLSRYPGIQALGWDPLVKDSERSLYESAARKDGFPDFAFTERSESGELVRAKVRDEYVVVYYIYPMEGNEPAFGYDISSNSKRLAAITKGFQTGELAATERIALVQETGSQFGVLLLLPLYQDGVPLNTEEDRRKGRKGFVVEVLRIGKAIETALAGFPDTGIELTLHDMSAEEGSRLLYHRPSQASSTSAQQVPAAQLSDGLDWEKTLQFAERPWRVRFAPSETYYATRHMWQGWLVLLGSLLMTGLLALYLHRKISYAIRIEQVAEGQAKANQDLRQALDEVKTLRGILPLCSFCKKIRDDEGYWEQVDVYIHKHSQADISHGICPECLEENYPEEFKRIYPEGR